MKKDLIAYPLFVRSGSTARICIEVSNPDCEDIKMLDTAYRAGELTVEVIPLEQINSEGKYPDFASVAAEFVDQAKICFSAEFGGEQEYDLKIKCADADFGVCGVYALDSDIYGMLPLRGDLHIHTTESDGKQSPLEVAARCRRIGLDFLAITDHYKYEPSVMAKKYWERLDTGFSLYYGEELSSMPAKQHILSIGGKYSVYSQIEDNMEQAAAEIAEIQKTLDIPEQANSYQTACILYEFQKIKEAGGLSVLCHPFWKTRRGYHTPTPITEYMIKNHAFDALELISGYSKGELPSNELQTSYYTELLSQGVRPVPVIGVTDAHNTLDGASYFGWYSTFVMSRSADFCDVAEAVRSQRSVAVSKIKDETMHLYGPFRYVKLCSFIAENFFPLHDRICYEQGEKMLEYLTEESLDIASDIEKAAKTYKALYSRLY